MSDESTTDMLSVHVFLVTSWSGEPRNQVPDEHDSIAWFTVDDSAKLPLAHAGYPALFRDAMEISQ